MRPIWRGIAREFSEVGNLPHRFQRAEPRVKVLVLLALAVVAALIVVDIVQRFA